MISKILKHHKRIRGYEKKKEFNKLQSSQYDTFNYLEQATLPAGSTFYQSTNQITFPYKKNFRITSILVNSILSFGGTGQLVVPIGGFYIQTSGGFLNPQFITDNFSGGSFSNPFYCVFPLSGSNNYELFEGIEIGVKNDLFFTTAYSFPLIPTGDGVIQTSVFIRCLPNA